MTNKTSRVLMALACLAPLQVSALGVGQINVRSALNENLNADIPLTVSSKDDLQGLSVRLAPAAVFAQAGMERSPLLSSLKFELQPDASGRQYIKVTSDQPVREPLLNFLVELEWAQGKLVREFAVFLDPPQAVLRHNGAPPLLAANPVNRSAIAAAPAARVAESMKFTGETYGPVSPGETLWSIAKLVKPAQVSTQQMMQALLRANPSAFNAPRVDALRAGAMLRIPDLGGGKAKPASASQVAANTPASPATPAKPETTAAEAAPRVRLLPPEGEGGQPTAAGSDGAASATPPATDATRSVDSQFRIALQGDQPRLKLAGLEDLRARMSTLVGVDNAALTAKPETEVVFQETRPVDEGSAASAPAASDNIPAATPVDNAALVATIPDRGAAANTDAPSVAPSADSAPTPVAESAPAQPAADVGPALRPANSQPAGNSASHEPSAPAPAVVPSKPAGPPPAPPSEEGLLDSLLANPLLPVAGGGGVALLLVLLLLMMRRRKAAESEESLDAAESGFETIEQEPAVAATAAAVAEIAESASLPEPPSTRSKSNILANPLERADLLLAVGNYREAENVVRQALSEDPTNVRLAVKLLEVHYATGNAESFAEEAELLHERLIDESDPQWEHIVQMGQQLCPDHPLFGGSGKAHAAAAAVAAVGIADSTGGGDEFAFVTEPTAIAASSGGAGKLDDELDVALMEWDSTAAVGSAETAAVSAAVAAPRLDDDLDSQLRSLDFAFDDELQNMAGDIGRPTSVATGAAADELPDNTLVLGQESAFPLQEEDTLTVELKDFDFGLDDQPPAPPVAEDQPAKSASPILVIEDPALGGDDHVETKLDLAQAYLDMEDKDGARSLLEEVLQEGDARQRQRAEELLRLVA